MREEVIKPELFNYSNLFSKSIRNEIIRDVHLWYVISQEFHPAGPIEGLIKSLFNTNKIKDAYYLILHYPYLTISKKILAKDINYSLKLLEAFSNEVYYKEHIDYAKGVLYNLHKEYCESNTFLININLNLLSTNKINDIERLIKENKLHCP